MWKVVRQINFQTLDQAQCDDSRLVRPFNDGQCYFYIKNGQYILPHEHILITDLTIERCKKHCFDDHNYLYAGLFGSSECFCGNVEPSNKQAPSQCNNFCSGNTAQRCGGQYYMNVYYKLGN